MIRPLRQRHYRTFIVLGILLPAAFAIGIAARKPAPVIAEIPAALAWEPQSFKFVEWQRADLFARVPVQVQLLRDEKNSGRYGFKLSADNNFVKPDLIVYWSAGNPAMTNTVPENAILLGAFDAEALPLPEAVERSSGSLLLFSLADGEIVEVSKPFSVQALGASAN
jgi:hypothetical protein